MNFYSATIESVRRFAARRRYLGVIEKRTYVFILVPFNFRGNGHGQRAEVEQKRIGGHSVDGTRDKIDLGLALDPAQSSEPIVDESVSDEPQLNSDLMWTWFLPNPLWPPKKRK
jgi:hypothetical protein